MGFRFRRTIKVAPGIRLNIGKKGISTSVGKRGAGVTFGPKGTTAHVGIPGTGMSYTKKVSSSSQSNSTNNKKTDNCSSNCGCFLLLFALIAIIWLFILGNIVEKYGNNGGYIFMGATFAAPIIFLIIYFICFIIKDKRDTKRRKEEDKFASNFDMKNKSTWTHSLDPLFIQSAYIIVVSQQGSITKLQRNFSIGINRAGRIMTQLEQAGIVGSDRGKNPRIVLVKNIESLVQLLDELGDKKDVTKIPNSPLSGIANSNEGKSVSSKSYDYKKEKRCNQNDKFTKGENDIIDAISSTADAAAKVAFRLSSLDHTPINPRKPFTHWKFPSIDLLKKYPSDDMISFANREELEVKKNRIIRILNDFDIQIRSIRATTGPTITLYEITPVPGIRISKIRNLEDDIALSLAANGVRVIAPIPGKETVGIEIPNEHANIVSMWSIINSRKFEEAKMELPIALGKTISNEIFMVDLAKIPHLLVAGATGQGKSVGLEAIITSLLYKKHPNELKLVLRDPKKVEFNLFAPIAKHFMAALEENEDEPIITDYNKAIKTLRGLCKLMDQRYDMLKLAQVRNIVEYNKKYLNHRLNPMDGHEFMPYIVVAIDEFGDLIMARGEEFEKPIIRIAQLAMAVGIHIVMATQRLSAKIITGAIKSEFPGRIAYRVGSRVDSQVILDHCGAQQLIGRGDMLYLNGYGEPIRVQGAFIGSPEIEAISRFIAEQPGPVEPLLIPDPDANNDDYNGSGGVDVHTLDPLFEQAAIMVVLSQQGSTSKIQRQFSIGYNRAGRLMDQLQQAGIVGEADGSKPREVLISDEATLEKLLQCLNQEK